MSDVICLRMNPRPRWPSLVSDTVAFYTKLRSLWPGMERFSF